MNNKTASNREPARYGQITRSSLAALLACTIAIISTSFGLGLFSRPSSQSLTVKAESMIVIDGVGGDGVRRVGDLTLIPSETKIDLDPATVVDIETEARNVEVTVTNKDREPIEFRSIDPKTHLLTTPGRHWVEVVALDFDLNIYSKQTIVVDVKGKVDPPEPDPGPGPEPEPDPQPPTPDPVPDLSDVYGLGLWVFKSSPVDHAKEIGSVYAESAEFLYGRPELKTIESVLEWATNRALAIPTTNDKEFLGWKSFLGEMKTKIEKSQESRPSGFTRADWYAALNEIASAMKAKGGK